MMMQRPLVSRDGCVSHDLEQTLTSDIIQSSVQTFFSNFLSDYIKYFNDAFISSVVVQISEVSII